MAVARSARDIPLALTADTLNDDVVAAYDFPGDTSGSNAGDGVDFVGGFNLTKNGTIPLVSGLTLPNGEGTTQARDVSNGNASGNFYSLSGGLYTMMGAHGTGDFSVWFRVRMPSSATMDNAAHSWARLTMAPGIYLQIAWFKISADTSYRLYAYEENSGTTLLCNWSDTPALSPSAIADIHFVRTAGVYKMYVNGTLAKTTTGSGASIASGAGPMYLGLAFGDSDFLSTLLIDAVFWTRALSGAEVTAQQANPYNYYAHASNPDVIAVISPADGSTVGANIAINGTYGGDNAPSTGIEASFNGGAYQTIVASPSGGTFSGTLTGQSAGTGTLTVRWKNNTSILDTVTSLTVTTNSITLTPPSQEFYPVSPATSGTASITVAGTYTGSPTSIEYRWNDGSWQTLVASPSGGTFSQSVSVTMGQIIDVRFSNATSVTAYMVVAAGDVFETAGQSNNVGQASQYVPPVAPAAHPRWVGWEYDKTGTYRQLVETAGNNAYSSTVGAQFAVWSGETGLGSFYGRLSTLLMEAGLVICFAPVARGSTTSANWLMNSGNPTSTSTLFGAALTVKNQIGTVKGLIYWQGEADVADPTTWSANTDQIINDWFTQAGTKVLLTAICKSSFTDPSYTTFHNAVEALANSNTHVAAFADMETAWNSGGVHYDGSTEINNVADIMFDALIAGFYSFQAVLPAIKDNDGNLVANTTLNWQWFDELTPPFGAAIISGTMTTDASGVPPVLNLPGTTLIAGEYGTIHASNLLEDRSNESTAVVVCAPAIVS